MPPGLPEVPELVGLYVPGDRSAIFDKALHSAADFVIVDLEDSVPAAGKRDARCAVLGWIAALDDTARKRVSVRVNAIGTPVGDADLAALAASSGFHSVRVPKVESAGDVNRVVSALGQVPVHALLESAAGIEAAASIASAPQVAALTIGEADLRSDLAVSSEEGLAWSRSRVVVAARAAGLPSPMMSAWTDLADTAGLINSCRAGRAFGFLGRTAVHPNQIEPIREGFTPTAEQAAVAQRILDSLGRAQTAGSAVTVTDDGRMVDAAMVRSARLTVALYEHRWK